MPEDEQNVRKGFGKNTEVIICTASGEKKVIRGKLKETEFPCSIEVLNAEDEKNCRIPYFGKMEKIERITTERGEILYALSPD